MMVIAYCLHLNPKFNHACGYAWKSTILWGYVYTLLYRRVRYAKCTNIELLYGMNYEFFLGVRYSDRLILMELIIIERVPY